MQQNGFKATCAAPEGCTIYTSVYKNYCVFHQAIFKNVKMTNAGTCAHCTVTAVKSSKLCYEHSQRAESPIFAFSV